MPRRRANEAPVAQVQQTLAGVQVYPHHSNPAADVGKKILVPDEYWAVPGNEFWPCAVLEFDPDHVFPRSKTKTPAFKLCELSRNEMFWVKHPDPYVRYRFSDETKARLTAQVP